MLRLLCCTLVLVGTILMGSSLATAQPFGVPPRIANPPNTSRPGLPPPGPSAEDVLRLLFPPGDDSQDDSYDDSRSNQRQVVRPAPRPVPSTATVANMSSLQQRGLLRQAVASLEQQLDQLAHGAGWKDFLHIESLGGTLWGQSSPSPDAENRNILKQIAKNFDAVKGNPNYSRISDLWGFKVAHVAMPIYSQSAVEKQQRQLGASLTRFDRSLSRTRVGAGWKKHLQTDEVKRLASKIERLSEPEEDLLREIRRRYDQVQEDDQYRVIRALRGYSDTRNSLREIVEAIEAERKRRSQEDVLKSLAVSKDATPLERTVIATLKELAKIKAACAEEGKAKILAALSSKTLALAPEDQKKELARKATEAEGILQLAKGKHDRAMNETDKNLRAILRLIKAGRKQQQEDETVLVLPLEDMVQVLPPEDSQDEADQVKVLAPENRKKKDKEAKKTKVLAPKD